MNLRCALSFNIAMAAVALAADAPVAPTPQKVLKDYKKLVRITKEPKSIAAELAILCRSTPPQDAVKKETGPHAMRYVHYYLNDAAQRRFESGGDGDYPAGSVIVKEKLSRSIAADKSDAMPVDAVAGMIKGAPGSNPQARDWEFFYFERNDAVQPGRSEEAWAPAGNVQHCAGCHSNARDMVFGRFNGPYKTPLADRK
jgi:hypothetical protein